MRLHHTPEATVLTFNTANYTTLAALPSRGCSQILGMRKMRGYFVTSFVLDLLSFFNALLHLSV